MGFQMGFWLVGWAWGWGLCGSTGVFWVGMRNDDSNGCLCFYVRYSGSVLKRGIGL